MSEPLSDIVAPTGQSRFNNPLGEGFVRWLDRLRQTAMVRDVEVLGIATKRAIDAVALERKTAAAEASAARAYADTAVSTAIRVTGLAIDPDGTIYFSPGSMNPRVLMDPDGTIYFEEL